MKRKWFIEISRGLLVCCVVLAGWAAAAESTGAAKTSARRIAVWNPEKTSPESRFKLDLPALNQAVGWLREAGFQVDFLTAEQIVDPQTFGAQSHDALLMIGDAFARDDLPAFRRFADAGGIMVHLGAKIPYLIAIGKDSAGDWRLSPGKPAYAWQSQDVLGMFGLRYVYNPAYHDQGMKHTVTPLLKRYLPDASDLSGVLRGWWIAPVKDGAAEYYPLLRSQRLDGIDVTPQLFIVRGNGHTAILSLNEWYCDGSRPETWSCSRQTVLALVRIAADLRTEKLKLTSEMMVPLTQAIPPAEPLRTRLPKGEVNPDQAAPVMRWGKFDGSSFDLGEFTAQGASLDKTAEGKDAVMPHALEAGAQVRLAVPELPEKACYLRVRLGFGSSNAGLCVRLGETTLINEIFSHIDASGAGNPTAPDMSGAPTEINRILFIPPTARAGGVLTISNPGRNPVYFDALQIETRSRPEPEMMVGLGAGLSLMSPGGKGGLTPEFGGQWSSMRCTTRTALAKSPETPERWADLDKLMDGYLQICPRVDMLLEGTPDWAAISPERYAMARKAGRDRTCPPDPQKYAQIVEHLVTRYADQVETYEIWNEADSGSFYRGSVEEYIAFFKTVAPLIRKLDPTGKIITTGMAGYKEEFVSALERNGVIAAADLFGFHPYAGKSPAWDLTYGVLQGDLISRGCDIEIYCNECGFVWKPAEWFTAPPQYTEEIQAQLMNVAIPRLLASGLAKLNIFNAGGDTHQFGVIDEKGRPRPAYRVIADYLPLGVPGSRRLDVAMLPTGPAPLKGAYRAAAVRPDGSAVIVVNASEADLSETPVRLLVPLPQAGGYRATCRAGDDAPAELPVALRQGSGVNWAELTLPVRGRAVVLLQPQK